MEDESSFASLLDDSFAIDDIDGQVAKLKDTLENFSLRLEPECLTILQDSLRSCSCNSLDATIFSVILPITHRHLCETVKDINDTLKTKVENDTLEDIRRKLLASHELLEIWENCIEHVSKIRNIPANDVKYLAENVPLTIKLIFEHCKASSKLYGSLFEGLSGELMNLFRKAKTILKLFLATLEGVIVFGTDTESETELLVKVIDAIGSIVVIVNDLDLKTLAEAFKTFGKLAIIHQNDVKRICSKSVTLHLEHITKDVSSMISTIKDSQNKIEEKKVKLIGHLLKILDKLFVAYCSNISTEALLSVIELLLQMHRCSPSCLRVLNIDEKIIDSINVLVSLGSQPFLSTIFKNSDFKQAFFEYRNQGNIDELGYHLLTISIMKKLISMPFQQNCKWTLGAESILDVALTNINNLQKEICFGEIRLPGARDIGERPRDATLYEATLVPICSLISQIPLDGFHVVELLLLKHLLGRQFWSSLLSMDVWCFIGRLGTSELCASHVKYLLKVHAALAKRRADFEVVVLESLIQRLYALLSEETRDSLVTELDHSDDRSWMVLARFLPPKTKSFLCGRSNRILKEIPDVFADLQRQPTVQNWNRLTTMLSIVGVFGHSGDKGTVDTLFELWNSIASTIENCEGRLLNILLDFIPTLLSATQPDNIADDLFFMIIEAAMKSSLCFSPPLKVIAAHYLRNNASSYDNCGPKSANGLADLNCQLLEDENPWVRQEAVESFDHVAHVCPSEDFVTKLAGVITKKASIRDFLSAYLSNEIYYELRDYSDVRSYLRNLTESFQDIGHVCPLYEDSERNEKLARMDSEKLSGEFIADSESKNFEERVKKICEELHNIVECRENAGDHVLRRLRATCTKVLEITEYLR